MGEKDKRSIVWDSVAIYPAGAIWQQETPPQPLFQKGPVIRVLPAFTQALQRAAGEHSGQP